MSNQESEFNEIKQRLDEIVDLVSDENIDLDEALSLYEEAVKLGIAACDTSEFLSEDDGQQVEGADSVEGDSGDSDSEEGHAENLVSEEGRLDAESPENELSDGQSATYVVEEEI